MERLNVELPDGGYPVVFLERRGELTALLPEDADRCFVLADEQVFDYYCEDIAHFAGNKPCEIYVVESGEQSKSFAVVEKIINAMSEAGLSRKSVVIAFGGGVTGDLGGFCASIFMRGIRFIQIPTTLLAVVDSSIGGKTGVNTAAGKNLAGTFWQPLAVYVCTEYLASLPDREYRAALGEVFKYGLLDVALLDYLRRFSDRLLHRHGATLHEIMLGCCRIKARVVAQDEKEAGLRKILNAGHTIAHALESATGYRRWLHGEAVVIGLHYETLLARRLGKISADYAATILDLLTKSGMDFALQPELAARLSEYMLHDKKNHDGLIVFMLPVTAGECCEVAVSSETMGEFMHSVVEEYAAKITT